MTGDRLIECAFLRVPARQFRIALQFGESLGHLWIGAIVFARTAGGENELRLFPVHVLGLPPRFEVARDESLKVRRS